MSTKYCVKSELDIFEGSKYQSSVESNVFCEYHPVSGVGQNHVEFSIPGSDPFVDISNVYLHVLFNVTNADGTVLAEDSKAYPVDCMLSSLFSEVEILYQNEHVSSCNFLYPYKNYLETVLNHNPAAKNSFLSAAGYYPGEEGVKTRKKAIASSKDVDLFGLLSVDCFATDKLLLNRVDVRIRLTRTTPAFFLIDPEKKEYSVNLKKCSLMTRLVKVSPQTALSIEKTLSLHNARYNFPKIRMRTLNVPTGTRAITYDNLFSGQIPKRLVIAFVDNESMVGSRDKDPFELKHFDLSEIALLLDGSNVFPLKVDVSGGNFSKAYFTQFLALGFLGDESNGSGMTMEEYKKNFVVCYNLTSDYTSDGELKEKRSLGNLRLNLNFSKDTPGTVSCVLYGEFDNTITFDSKRECFKDF